MLENTSVNTLTCKRELHSNGGCVVPNGSKGAQAGPQWDAGNLLHAELETTSEDAIPERAHSPELGWCAGFFDGEACVLLAKQRRDCGHRVNYRARVHIPQNCLDTLLTFKDRTGVHCNLVKLSQRESYTRQIYQLNYEGIHAYNLLKKLRPYLIRKANEADVIFEYYRVAQPSRHFGPKGAPAEVWHLRERFYNALRCLK